MPELKKKYDAGIPEWMANLKELAAASQQNPETIKEFKASVHKISGTAGTFGYGPVTDMCKAMEVEIVTRLEAGTANDPAWLDSLQSFINKVEEGFRHSTMTGFDEEETSPAQSGTAPATPQISVVDSDVKFLEVLDRVKKRVTVSVTAPAMPQLFVVDSDVKFLELLERVKEGVNLSVSVESDPKKALDLIQSSGIRPQGLLVSQSFKSSPITGLDLIKAQAEKNSDVVTALLLEKDSIDTRFEAVKLGTNYIFCKPISGYALMKSLEEALEVKPTSAVKVMIVDDDTIFCDYVTDVLSEIGVNAIAIQDPVDLFNKLQVFKPQIILLDLMLPKYDGFNLLKTLRQDVAYKNLAIVIVTGSEALDTRINAYSANVDDILFKPIDRNILQKRILSIAHRRMSSQGGSDDYLGLLHIQELTSELNKQLKKPSGSEGYLALFEVHNFAEWSLQQGDASVRELMIFISNQLQWESDQSMRCFWYKKSVFAIIFEGLAYTAIEKKLFSFLLQLIQIQSKAHLSFDCGLVPISKDFESASKVLNACEECLLEASKKESAPVRLVHKGAEKAKKEIVIVDPNPDLLSILKTAFEMHGLIVTTYIEGGEALNKILACSENRLPALILVERKLADMDGMDLYLKLKSRFRNPIPCFMLTVFSADKDISDSIRHGVLEYIVKPFNISILVQKVLQTIYKNL
jgi:DNA-binding response OmpR family regulator